MRRRVWPWLLLLALALLLLGWWSLRDPEAFDEGGPPIERRADAPDAPPPVELGASHEAEPEARLTGIGRTQPARGAAPLATLRCRVQGPDGAPRPRSLVQLEREVAVERPADTVPRGFEATRWTRLEDLGGRRADVHGLVSFAELPPGRYRVQALAPPGLLAPEALVDLGATDVDLDLAYRRTVTARIEVLDAGGRPVPQAGVTLERGHAKGVTTDEEGIAMLEELDPRWDVGLRIRPPAAENLLGLTLDPWRVRDTRVVLPAGLSVAGRVVDEDGEPVPKARVHRRVDGDSWKITIAGRDGRFSFERLRAGDELTLCVGPPGSWADAVTEAVTVVAGTEDLSVVLPRGAVLEVVVLDWPAGARGQIRLTSTSEKAILRSAPIGEDGHCTFRYLDPRDVHVLWGVLQGGDERFLYRARVRAQAEPLEVRLQAGEPIHVRVEVPEGVMLRGVDAFGPGVHRRAVLRLPLPGTVGNPAEDGTVRIPPLPLGRWEVRALGTSFEPPAQGPESWAAEAVARTGDVVELVLQKAN